MSADLQLCPFAHDHKFLGAAHQRNERKTWAVIALCTAMMLAEIVGGSLFGSLALIADGWHMSTHAGALLLAALAYTYARRHADDPSFAFGTGKIGDLAGYTSAIILGLIAILICYEASLRLINPVAIDFSEAIPIAVAGLVVNIVSAVMLSGGEGHHHGHGHAHAHGQPAGHSHDHGDGHDHGDTHSHAHHAGPASSSAAGRDNNMRAAFFHVIADAAVSVLVIFGLVLARVFGWLWLDPLAGIIGSFVIASWSYVLLRDTAAILLDRTQDGRIMRDLRVAVEAEGDRLNDLHLWRLGPGHLGAIVSVVTRSDRGAAFYHALLRRFHAFSHVTVEISRPQ
jgi:cation diffusion facilitator family transporter